MHAFRILPLYFVTANSSSVGLWNRILKIKYGAILPLLHVSMSYCIIAAFSLQLIFSFAFITEHIDTSFLYM